MNQVPGWVWGLLPVGVLLVLLFKQRWPRGSAEPALELGGLQAQVAELKSEVSRLRPVRGETMAELQQEMLRGLLRKEGLLPPAAPTSGPGEVRVIQCPQQFKIVPVDVSRGT